MGRAYAPPEHEHRLVRLRDGPAELIVDHVGQPPVQLEAIRFVEHLMTRVRVEERNELVGRVLNREREHVLLDVR